MKSECVSPQLDDVKGYEQLDKLAAKEYLDFLKNLLEVPKYLVSLLVFLATATAAISRIGPIAPSNSGVEKEPVTQAFGDLERVLFLVAMLFTLWVLILGFRVVAQILNEMMLVSDAHNARRVERFNVFRCGPYSDFVRWAMLALALWAFSLICVVW